MGTPFEGIQGQQNGPGVGINVVVSVAFGQRQHHGRFVKMGKVNQIVGWVVRRRVVVVGIVVVVVGRNKRQAVLRGQIDGLVVIGRGPVGHAHLHHGGATMMTMMMI